MRTTGKHSATVLWMVFLLAVLLVAPPVFAGGQGERGGASPEDRATSTAPVIAFASVAPQGYFLERIGGEHVVARLLIGPGQDAHTYDPSPREIEQLGRAELLFTTGLEFEARIVETLQRARSPVSIVDLTEGIALRELEAHWHDPSVPHSHDNEPGDPHIWLGPAEVRVQAATMRDALMAARPALAQDFQAGYQAFIREVDALEEEMAAYLEPLRGTAVLVYHPAFGYLLDHFGITQLAIEAGGREPSPRQLQVTIEKALAAGVTVVFTQPEYDDVASRAVARAIGATTVEITDLDSDWPAMMRRITRAVAAGE